MRYDRLITSLFSADPTSAAAFFVRHLGMEVALDIGWFVSLVHPDHPGTEVALTQSDHPSVPEAARHAATGVAIAVVVDDAAAVHESLTAQGCEPLSLPTDHPWGQRQFFAPGPDGVLLDVVEITEPDPQWLTDNGIVGSPDAGGET